MNRFVVKCFTLSTGLHTVWDCIEGVNKQMTVEQIDQEESWGATIDWDSCYIVD